MKIVIIAGTRPEAIKVAPVVHQLRKYSQINVILCNTGQHKEMIEQAFSDFEIKPDVYLNVMEKNQTLSSLSARLFNKIGNFLIEENPNWVLVQGDTTTVMVGALCAFYNDINIGHIEAGLRSFDRRSPFPEELNREIVTKVADKHYAPTRNAYDNLVREGIETNRIIITGNTSIDALYWMKNKIANQYQLLDEEVRKAQDDGKKIILVTGHRRENIGSGFVGICQAIRELADTYNNIVFVYPVHLNPQVRKTIIEILGGHKRIILLEPLTYKRFIALLNSSYFVMTDSGGIQEEAPALGKPILVMRNVTERPEGISSGCAKLVGTEKKQIISNASILLEDRSVWKKMSRAKNPYGDGKASHYIVESILEN